MKKKSLTTLAKDQQQSSVHNFLTFHCNMHNPNVPGDQDPEEPSADIEVHFSVKASASTIRAFSLGIGTVIKVLVPVLSTFVISAPSLNSGDLSQTADMCVQPPTKEVQVPKDVTK